MLSWNVWLDFGWSDRDTIKPLSASSLTAQFLAPAVPWWMAIGLRGNIPILDAVIRHRSCLTPIWQGRLRFARGGEAPPVASRDEAQANDEQGDQPRPLASLGQRLAEAISMQTNTE